MLSRPVRHMYHGSPAAGRLCPGDSIGVKRSAARSVRLRRYVLASGSQSQRRRGAAAIQPARLSRSCSGVHGRDSPHWCPKWTIASP
jgi:hypothetical protein